MSRVRGVARVRSLLGRIEPAIRDEIARELRDVGGSLLSSMEDAAPVRTGRFERALSLRLYEKTLKLSVGLIGKPANRRLFYARILEFGRKAQTVTVQRRTANGSISTYALHVRGLPPRHTVFSPRTALRQAFNGRIKGIWDRALQKAASGATGND